MSEVMIGVDVGGTHTDTCVAADDQIVRAKAFTTPDDYSRGLIDALTLAAQRLDRTLDQLLSDATALVNGTTVVTNALTELRGARVGVITTAGFRDTLRFAGGARRPVYDDQLQVSPPDVAPRDCILEVDERVTKDGSVLVALDEAAVIDAVARLRSRGVETVAICFLWSFRNPAHERRARELVHERWPDAFVTLSSDIHPVIREHERFFSAVFNSYCQPAASRLLRTVADRLAGHGFGGTLTFFSGAGGAIPGALAERFPLLLLASGPAGGVRGAIDLAGRMGLDDVLVGDMGGTSFDTTLVSDRRPRIAGRLEVAGLPTAINVVDVVSIGAGGGSVAWVDERGVPQVGPQSAGSTPGPACYGRGGDRPTVTDAALVSGILDADSYLDGRVPLDRDAAFHVIERYGTTFGWSIDAAADAIMQLTIANMADALRAVTVERGRDPSRLVLIGYGGTLPMFAAAIAERLHIARVVLPANSSVFSAFGVLVAPYARRYTRSLQDPLDADGVAARIEAARGEMSRSAIEEAALAGIAPEDLSLRWDVELRFAGQVSELELPLARTPFTAATASALAQAFPARYEEIYGPGTAWDGAPVMLVNLIVTATAYRHRPPLQPATPASDAPPATDRRRAVLIEGGTRLAGVPVYDGAAFEAGMRIAGPAIVDEHDTTVLVPARWDAVRDRWHSCVLERTA
jgi:N-methylhydantoinase A